MPFINSGTDFKEEEPGILQLARKSLEFSRRSIEPGRRSRGSRPSGEKNKDVELGGADHEHETEVAQHAKRVSMDIQRISMEVQRKRSKDAARAAAKADEKEEEEGEKIDFTPAPKDGLTTAEAEELLKKWGKNELVEKSIPKWLILLRLLTGPMPIMLWIAALVELIIGNYPDMAILLVIQFTNAGI
eukprot:746901-Hanusia_phi.AAC.9